MVVDHPEYDDHELVAVCRNAESGLTAIIALHDTSAGPAMGGCRVARYPALDDALTDVLRLSKGMTYKNIMAGLPYGGGKAVVVADPRTEKTPALLRAFAQAVERLGGSFITGEDVGVTVADIETMRSVTSHVRGIPLNGPGDPSPMTARGVFRGIQTAAMRRLGAADLKGVRVVVQGLGAVGMRLAALLNEAGATLFVSDIEQRRIEEAAHRLGAIGVAANACHAIEAEVYAPCALGGTLSERTIAELRVQVVAGAANNQLATPEDGRRLAEREVLYAPDYVINAGGVISTALEGPSFDPGKLVAHVDMIPVTLAGIFARAAAEGLPTSVVADRVARERLIQARARRRVDPMVRAA
jgi:leucine dehydrogenase